jgi:hypothetical protein
MKLIDAVLAEPEPRDFPASNVRRALDAHGLGRGDWLKCDTQGIDLQFYLSLPENWRRRMLAAEFEPGLVDVCEKEDTTSEVFSAMTQAFLRTSGPN